MDISKARKSYIQCIYSVTYSNSLLEVKEKACEPLRFWLTAERVALLKLSHFFLLYNLLLGVNKRS